MTTKMYFIGKQGPMLYDDSVTYLGNVPIIYTPGDGKLKFFSSTFPYITDSDNGFVTAGFVANDIIVISGTVSNDGVYQATIITAGKMVLGGFHVLVAETGTIGTTIKTPAIGTLLGESVVITQALFGKMADRDGDTSISVEDTPDGDTIVLKAGGIGVGDLTTAGFKLENGARVDEFSTDGTMVGNSDVAVPTEKAIVTYAGDTISKKHDRQHAIDDTSDHTSSIVDGNIIVGDSDGLPSDGGDSITEVKSCDNHVSGSTNFVLVKASLLADLDQTISDPPTKIEVQAISDKIDDILSRLRSANVIAT